MLLITRSSSTTIAMDAGLKSTGLVVLSETTVTRATGVSVMSGSGESSSWNMQVIQG